MGFQNGIILFSALLATSAVASEGPRQHRPRGIVSGEVSPGRISDPSVYRAGLRLIGSMPPDQGLGLLRAMLGDSKLSEPQMERTVMGTRSQAIRLKNFMDFFVLPDRHCEPGA